MILAHAQSSAAHEVHLLLAPMEGGDYERAMHLETQAVVCAVRAHGEHGAIVRALTPADGIQPGYVRGGRSRRLRPILLPGNVIQAEYRARTEEQLAQLSVELVHSRAPLHGEPLPAAGIDWACALTATALPEAQPFPRLHQALEAVLTAIESAPAASGWCASLVRFELLLLTELGFGLDLDECAATGTTENLAFVSPKSGRGVSREGAGVYRDKLLPLPAFLLAGGAASWSDVFDGLRLTGHFLERDVLTDRRADILAARERLVERMRRVTR